MNITPEQAKRLEEDITYIRVIIYLVILVPILTMDVYENIFKLYLEQLNVIFLFLEPG